MRSLNIGTMTLEQNAHKKHRSDCSSKGYLFAIPPGSLSSLTNGTPRSFFFYYNKKKLGWRPSILDITEL